MRTPALFVVVFAAACGSKTENDAPDDADAACGAIADGELKLLADSNNGVFDPSVEIDDDGVFWMSHSAIERSPEGHDRVTTHLARSSDAITWCEVGAANANTPSGPGVLNHEVSSLVRDVGAPEGQRWKLYWHRYVLEGATRRFDLGSLVVRSAATPEGLLTDSEADVQIEAASQLSDCLVYTEPGAVSFESRLLLAIQCATARDQHVVMLELDRFSGYYEYRGTLLRPADLAPLNPVITGVAAPALYVRDGALKLIVSPVVEPLYAGCLDYALNLTTYTVGPPLHAQAGLPGELVGACELEPAAANLGLLVSQTMFASEPVFHIKAPGTVW